MEKVLPPPLLLLLFLLLGLSPGHAPRPTLAGSCDPANTIPVKEGENRIISSKSGQFRGRIDLSVMPGSEFEGVRLDVRGSDGTFNATWFPADEECFPRDGRWLEFKAVAKMVGDGFRVGFRTAACLVMCTLDHAPREPGNLTVVAYGQSVWLKGTPSFDCPIFLITPKKGGKKPSSCQEPPSSTINTTTANMASGTPSTTKQPTKTIMTIAATAAGVMVVAAVAIYCKRRSVIPPQPADLAPSLHEPQVIENDDIYESCDGLTTSAAPQTFHNDLYESIGSHGPRHDS